MDGNEKYHLNTDNKMLVCNVSEFWAGPVHTSKFSIYEIVFSLFFLNLCLRLSGIRISLNFGHTIYFWFSDTLWSQVFENWKLIKMQSC